MMSNLLLKININEPDFWQSLFNNKYFIIFFPIILGLFCSMAYVPFSIWPITLISLSILFCINIYLNGKRLFFFNLIFFATLNTKLLDFLNYVMQGFGNIPLILSWLILIVFSIYLALPYALALVLAKKISKNKNYLFLLCSMPAFLAMADWVSSVLFTGFPWNYFAYSLIDSPFIAFAPIIGAKGINLMLYICTGALALTINRQFIYLPIAGVIFILCIFMQSLSFTKEQSQENIVMIQGNIPQELRWSSSELNNIISKYVTMSQEYNKDNNIIIWPESALPLYLQTNVNLIKQLQSIFTQNSSLITGVQSYVDNKSYNSILLIDKNSDFSNNSFYIYNKRHLVPFGEKLPFKELLRPLGSIFNFPMSDFANGDNIQSNLKVRSLNLIPAICYEAIFPNLIQATDSPESNGILMISNDSWFGPTNGPLEHLQIARMRVFELQKPMIRVTNSGISAYINQKGQITNILPSFKDASVKITMSSYNGQTIYSKYADIPLYSILCILLIITFALRGKKAKVDIQKLIRP